MISARKGSLLDWGYLWYQVRRSPLMAVGTLIILTVLICTAFAPWIAPHDPNAINLIKRLAPPSLEHPFGTDEVGRDLFSRVIYGSRASVGIGLAIVIAVAGSVLLGLSLWDPRKPRSRMRRLGLIALVISFVLAVAPLVFVVVP